MKLIAKRLRNLNEFYGYQLQMLLSAEEQILQLLLDMQGWASDEELRSAFAAQQQETDLQVPRIKDLVSANTIDGEPVKCKVLTALATETEDMVGDTTNPIVCDVALITAAQRVKHYEIAVYGAIRNFARILGKDQNAEMLDALLREEKYADYLLTGIANRLNVQAKETFPH